MVAHCIITDVAAKMKHFFTLFSHNLIRCIEKRKYTRRYSV